MIDNKHKVFNQVSRNVFIGLFLCCFLFVYPTFVLAQNNYYIPSTFIIPVHTQANELHISAGVSYGYSLNASYSLSNRLALFATGGLANGTYTGQSVYGTSFRSKKDNYSVAGGIGYLFSPTTTPGNVFELFVGGGKYESDNYQYTHRYRDGGTETYASYWSMFGQFNAITKTGKVELGAALRLAYNNYSDLKYAHKLIAPYAIYSVNDLWSLNAEPVLSISYMIKKVKLNAQGGISWPLISGNNTPYYIDPYTQEFKEDTGTKIGVGSLIGSINLQYNLSLRKE